MRNLGSIELDPEAAEAGADAGLLFAVLIDVAIPGPGGEAKAASALADDAAEAAAKLSDEAMEAGAKALDEVGAATVRASKSAAQRASEIHGLLDPRAQRSRTTAVTETAEGPRIVTSSESRLSPTQRAGLEPGEVEGIGPGHAEVTGRAAAEQMGLTPTGTAASRPICPECANDMANNGVTPLSTLRE